jgi:hypothetical protein
MMSWRRRRRARIAWADTVGEAFIAEFGIDAYSTARRLERDATNHDLTSHWARVAQRYPRRTKKDVVLNAAERMGKDVDLLAASKTRSAAETLETK